MLKDMETWERHEKMFANDLEVKSDFFSDVTKETRQILTLV
jgi:hypothetical protein